MQKIRPDAPPVTICHRFPSSPSCHQGLRTDKPRANRTHVVGSLENDAVFLERAAVCNYHDEHVLAHKAVSGCINQQLGTNMVNGTASGAGAVGDLLEEKAERHILVKEHKVVSQDIVVRAWWYASLFNMNVVSKWQQLCWERPLCNCCVFCFHPATSIGASTIS